MLRGAAGKAKDVPFFPVQADITRLPFRDASFDKAVSITALEFIEDAETAVNELFRVTRPGGTVIVATLNSLSPWAERRQKKGEGHILENAFYRSPSDLLHLTGLQGEYETVVHFRKDADPAAALLIEKEGKSRNLDTGAFLAARWRKPR